MHVYGTVTDKAIKDWLLQRSHAQIQFEHSFQSFTAYKMADLSIERNIIIYNFMIQVFIF